MAAAPALCDDGRMTPIRTLLVDDSVHFLGAARSFLSGRPGLQVVDDVVSGREALLQAGPLQADLILLDLNMAGLNGLETARRLKALPAPPKIVVVSYHDASEYRRAALAAGADAFVSKTEFAQALLPVIAALFPAHAAHLQRPASGGNPA
jgi:two-component system nitrate/nitrite response regulator NarL